MLNELAGVMRCAELDNINHQPLFRMDVAVHIIIDLGIG